jgi:hypothetical protein
MLRLLLTAVYIFVIFTALARGRECPVDGGDGRFEDFRAREKSLLVFYEPDELSPAVAERVRSQLIMRVGEPFAKKLAFSFGNAFDFDDAAKMESASEINRIDAYSLIFTYSDLKIGIKEFSFDMVTDENGTITQYLSLPDIAGYPGKTPVVTCREVLKIAKRQGFPTRKTSIDFEYDEDSGSFVWIATDSNGTSIDDDRPGASLGVLGTYKKVMIDAATGKVIKIYKESIGL